tara:strand:- start:623 stop:1762 length:1140 start_codon:yes stop_codon:yes gene_type:complete
MKIINITLFILFFFKPLIAIESIAKQAIVYDMQTNSIIYEKNADELMSPSSMSKLLTVYYVFKKLKNGEISLNDKFKVSKKAWKKGGSKMFISENSLVSIEDLLRGIIVQSGNDACITIAEGFSGTESNFAGELNLLAKEIGLENSNFTNSTGWPDPEHLTTTRDLLKIAIRTINDFPELYKYYAEKEFTYNKIRQINRNPLLFVDPNADGLKTGHTSLGGYGLIASSKRLNRRIILIVNGLNSSKERKFESKKLMDAAFFQYKNVNLDQKIISDENIFVWNGVKKNLKLYSKEDVNITVPKLLVNEIKFYIKYKSPVSAPVEKDSEIAVILVKNKKGEILKRFPLFAFENINEMNFVKKIFFKFKYLIFGDSLYQTKK